MKRPIAELVTMRIKASAERDWMAIERELWGILRRKQGYVTHRVYQPDSDGHARLIYSEWQSRQAASGARQPLHGSPLMRRAQATIEGSQSRSVVELSGVVTSTKGLDLPEGAIAVVEQARRTEPGTGWRDLEQKVWTLYEGQSGYITHVTFRGFDDDLNVGAMSHWASSSAYEEARKTVAASEEGRAAAAQLTNSTVATFTPVAL